jgi:hypothetical protein
LLSFSDLQVSNVVAEVMNANAPSLAKWSTMGGSIVKSGTHYVVRILESIGANHEPFDIVTRGWHGVKLRDLSLYDVTAALA